MREEATRGGEGPQAVDDADPEPDRRRIREVLRGDRDLDHGQVELHGLEDDLGVEHEPVRVAQEGHRLQEPPRVGAIARMALGELPAHGQVLHGGEEAVRDLLPFRHPALGRAARVIMREPSTMSARPSWMGLIISGMIAGSYCPSGWSMTTMSAPSRSASM